MECGVPIKEGAGLCHGCGEIVPEYMSPMVRTSSTSALYAEQNWDFRTQLWSNGDIFDQSKYELWGGIEIDTRQLRINRPGEDEREDEVLRELTEEEFERYKDRARENNE